MFLFGEYPCFGGRSYITLLNSMIHILRNKGIYIIQDVDLFKKIPSKECKFGNKI